jgi:hypothetical protein
MLILPVRSRQVVNNILFTHNSSLLYRFIDSLWIFKLCNQILSLIDMSKSLTLKLALKSSQHYSLKLLQSLIILILKVLELNITLLLVL